jgi:formamidopyrimidine-DNA glycosylase
MALHCHAMMYGSWQFGKPGMKLRKPEKNVRLRLRTISSEAVFFNGPVVELLTAEELHAHKRLTALGPDILHPDFDRDEAWERLRRAQGRPIGDALLDQTIVAGIGNIFKSEGLFLAGLDPRVAVESTGRDQVERIWELLIPVMLANAARSGPVVTLNRNLRRGAERYWAYRRAGRPCFRCNSIIEMVRQGKLRRTTYFCRGCQDHGGFLLDEPANVQAL